MTAAADSDSGRVIIGVSYRTVESVCEGPGCAVVIEQPDRPGRKRRFHSDACRQAAFRLRKKKPSAETAAWIRALNQRAKS